MTTKRLEEYNSAYDAVKEFSRDVCRTKNFLDIFDNSNAIDNFIEIRIKNFDDGDRGGAVSVPAQLYGEIRQLAEKILGYYESEHQKAKLYFESM